MLAKPLRNVPGAHIRYIVSPQVQSGDHILVLQEVAKFLNVDVLQILALNLNHGRALDAQTLYHCTKIVDYRGFFTELNLFNMHLVFLPGLRRLGIFKTRFKMSLNCSV